MNLVKVGYSMVFVVALALILLTVPASAQMSEPTSNTTEDGNQSVGICVIGVESPCNDEKFEVPDRPVVDSETPARPSVEENEPYYRNGTDERPPAPTECVPGPATMCDHHLIDPLPPAPTECVPGPATMCDHHLKNQSNNGEIHCIRAPCELPPTHDIIAYGMVEEPITDEAMTEQNTFESITGFFKTVFSKFF
jgi:hypothetical protein